MNENYLVYINGDMLPVKDAKISILDRVFQYGDGIFEGLRAYDGRIFKLKEHTDRLYKATNMIGIVMPMSKEDFNEAIKKVIRENNFQNAHIKPIVSRGNVTSLGLDPRNTTEPNIVILARPIGKSMFDFENGFKLASVSVRKVPPMCLDPRVKSCNYLVNILARQEALASGGDEAIMYDINGYVAEGGGDNIFLVCNGELYTPEVWEALAGITRETVIELANKHNIKVHENKLTSYDVYNADEIFITSTGGGIVAITEVDKREVSGGKMGPITKLLCKAYEEETKKGESAYD